MKKTIFLRIIVMSLLIPCVAWALEGDISAAQQEWVLKYKNGSWYLPLEETLRRIIIASAQRISDNAPLKKWCLKAQHGKTHIKLEDFCAIAPLLVEDMKSFLGLRAVRPEKDAVTTVAIGYVASDLSFLTQLMLAIQNRINEIESNLSSMPLMQAQLTTISSALQNCCDSMLAGLDSIISMSSFPCNQVATFTMLDSIILNQNDTFTVLDSVLASLEGCCNETFTVLEEITTQLSTLLSTQTAFYFTFSLLTNLQNSQNTSFSLLSSLTNSTNVLQGEFNTLLLAQGSTFTVLATLQNEQVQSFSLLAQVANDVGIVKSDITTLAQECQGTFTVLGSVRADQNGTFSVLDVLEIALVSSGTTLASLKSTLTVMAGVQINTFTSVIALNNSFSLLTGDCAGTFTVLSGLQVGQNNTFTVLTALTNLVTTQGVATFTTLNTINNSIINLNAFTVVGPTTTLLNTAGSFILSSSLVGPLTISSNDVSLDLNGYAINGGSNGILVAPNLERVAISNGSIVGSVGSAVSVGSGNKALHLSNLVLANAGSAAQPYALSLQGTVTSRITAPLLENILTYSSLSGILLDNVDAGIIKECTVTNCLSFTTFVGIALQGTAAALAQSNSIEKCLVTSCTSLLMSSTAFRLVNTAATRCSECAALDIFANFSVCGLGGTTIPGTVISSFNAENLGTVAGSLAVGLLVSGTESKGVMIDKCILNNVIGIQNVTGIYLNAPAAIVQNVLLNGLTGVGSTIGIDLTATTANTAVANITLTALLSTQSGVNGIQVSAPAIALENLAITDLISPTTATGIRINTGGSTVTVNDATILNVQGVQQSNGILSAAVGTFLNNCLINSIISNGLANGCLVDTTGLGATLNQVQAVNITGTGPASTAVGININGSSSLLEGTLVNTVIAPTARGYLLASGAANSLLDNCLTVSCSGVGFLVNGSGNLLSSITSKSNSGDGILITGANNTVGNSVSQLNGGNGLTNTGLNTIIHDSKFIRCVTGISNSQVSAGIANNIAANNSTAYSSPGIIAAVLGALTVLAGSNLSI